MNSGVAKWLGCLVLMIAGVASAQEPAPYNPGRKFSDLTAAEQTAAKAAALHQPIRPLVACADPANLPFADRNGDGMDDQIAGVLADAMHTTVSSYWRSYMNRNFLKRAFGTAAEPLGHCDLPVDKGADVNATGRGGVTVLMIAAGYDNAPLIALLIQAGAMIDARADNGKSARDVAKGNGNDTAESTLELMARFAPHPSSARAEAPLP